MPPFSLRLRGPSCPSWITESLVTVDPDAQKRIHQEASSAVVAGIPDNGDTATKAGH